MIIPKEMQRWALLLLGYFLKSRGYLNNFHFFPDIAKRSHFLPKRLNSRKLISPAGDINVSGYCMTAPHYTTVLAQYRYAGGASIEGMASLAAYHGIRQQMAVAASLVTKNPLTTPYMSVSGPHQGQPYHSSLARSIGGIGSYDLRQSDNPRLGGLTQGIDV